jgi:hypothetical protein
MTPGTRGDKRLNKELTSTGVPTITLLAGLSNKNSPFRVESPYGLGSVTAKKGVLARLDVHHSSPEPLTKCHNPAVIR